MVYSKEHKIILQAVIHEGALPEDRIKELVTTLFGNDDTAQVLSEINAKLQPLYMTIKCINCEITGQLYWIFTTTVQDKFASIHPEFSQEQLALLRNIFSEIVTSNDGCVSSTWCLNLCSFLNLKLTKAAAEEFLCEMVRRNYLVSKAGKYYMGVKSVGELLPYFKDTYEDNLQTCTLCKQALFYGEKCSECDAMTHIHCLKNYTMNHSALGCPNCLTSERTKTNSATVIDVIKEEEPTQSSQMRKSRRRRNK